MVSVNKSRWNHVSKWRLLKEFWKKLENQYKLVGSKDHVSHESEKKYQTMQNTLFLKFIYFH